MFRNSRLQGVPAWIGSNHFRHALMAVAVGFAGVMTVASVADAKTPGKTYCFHGTCHTVRTIAETQALVGKTVVVKASFYDDCKNDSFNPCGLTSSGESFRAWKADNAASPVYPDGTKVLVWHPKTKKTLVVRINNAGPYWGDRKLDLSRGAAEKLGVSGVTTVHVRVLEAPTQKEATYSRNRTYAPVQGFVGVFADMDRAFQDIGKSIASLFKPPATVAVAASAIPAATPAAKKAAKPATQTAVKIETAKKADAASATKRLAGTTAGWASKSALGAGTIAAPAAFVQSKPKPAKTAGVAATKRKTEPKPEAIFR